MAERKGFEPLWVAPNGFQDRLVMTASITLRINYLYIIPHQRRIVKIILRNPCAERKFSSFYISTPFIKFSKQSGAYLSDREIRIPSMCRKRAVP